MWQIAQRDYKFGKGKQKTLNKATYDAIGNHFRKLWGKEAGWAHSVLFTADLKTFADRLTSEVKVEKSLAKSSSKRALKKEPTVKTEEMTRMVTAKVSVKRERDSETEDILKLDGQSVLRRSKRQAARKG